MCEIDDLKVGSPLYEINIMPFYVREYRIGRETTTRWVLKHPNTNFNLDIQVNKHNLERYGGVTKVVYHTSIPADIQEKLIEKEMLEEFLILKKAFDAFVNKTYNSMSDEMRDVYEVLKKHRG